MVPNHTTYRWWSCHRGHNLLYKLCRTFPSTAMGARFTVFWATRPYGPAGWLALLLTKAGDVKTNPDPTTLNKRAWICDICHKQIHVRKQISIRCNRIEHGVHARCAGIRKAQCTMHRYLDLPSTQIIQTHPSHINKATLPLPTLVHSPTPYPLPTYTTHTHTTVTKTQTHVQYSPCSHRVKPKPNPLIHSAPPYPHHPEPTTYTCHTLHLHLSPHSSQARHLY